MNRQYEMEYFEQNQKSIEYHFGWMVIANINQSSPLYRIS